MASEWYVFKNNNRLGPFSSQDLRRLTVAGSLSPDDLVWKEGINGWIPAQNIKGLFSTSPNAQQTAGHTKPIVTTSGPSFAEFSDTNNEFTSKQPPAMPVSSSRQNPPALTSSPQPIAHIGETTSGSLAEEIRRRRAQAADAFQLYRLFWSRILISDFHIIQATKSEIERLELASTPVKSPLAQDYASWRRSLLMVCVLVLGITLLFTGYDVATETFNESKHTVIRLQALSLFIFQIVSFLLCINAAYNWSNVKASRTYSRLAWLFQFAGPFLVFFTPLSLFVSNPFVLMQLGVSSIVTLAPKIFGLFPGILRCSLSIKTLLPESAATGWLTIVIVPIYFLFLLVPAIAAIQFSFYVLGIGLLMTGIGSFVSLLSSTKLLKPLTQLEASNLVGRIKKFQSLFQLVGICCVVFQIVRSVDITLDMLNNLLLFSFSYLGNVTLLTLVMSDFMIGMIRESQIQTEEFMNSDMLGDYQLRMEQLSACGLTDFDAGELEFASKIQASGVEIAKRTVKASRWNQSQDPKVEDAIDDFA